MSVEKTKIPLSHGNIVNWPFQLKRAGQNSPPDVSAATSIRIEWEDKDGATQTPIALASGTVGADWSAGLVVAVFTASDATATLGDYPFSLTVFLAGEEITYDRGTLEVTRRPGYPTP